MNRTKDSSGDNGDSTTYADAGVNLNSARRVVDLIKGQVRSTFRNEVVGDIGGFAGAFAFDPTAYKDPLLVSATDGVGTKVMIAELAGVHDTIGIDLVAMSVNDVAAHGAEPLFFLDYIVSGKIVPAVIDEIVKGIVVGCRDAGCALIGGETAEHPGHMAEGSYDLAGFCVGVVDRDGVITGKGTEAGDAILGVASSGLHSNGYSLVRKVLLEDMGLKLTDRPMQMNGTLAEELLTPTLIYSPMVKALTSEVTVRSLAHITGGGIPGNVERIIPDGLKADIDTKSWEVPPIFDLISSLGAVKDEEMHSTFNMGVGMVAVVPAAEANHAVDVIRAAGHRAFEIGMVTERQGGDQAVRLG